MKARLARLARRVMAASGNAARTASIRVMARRLGEGDGARLFADAPGDQQLRQWAVATGVEYQAWVFLSELIPQALRMTNFSW